MRSQSKAILVGGLVVLPGLAFLGNMGDQNRELHKAQVRRELLPCPPLLEGYGSHQPTDG